MCGISDNFQLMIVKLYKLSPWIFMRIRPRGGISPHCSPHATPLNSQYLSQVTQKYCDNVISKCTKILSQHYFFEVFDNVTMLNIAETLLQHFFEIL